MKNIHTIQNKRYVIKIPKNIKVFYYDIKKIIIFKGFAAQKSIRINNLLTIYFYKQKLEVTKTNSKILSNINKRKLKMIQITTISLIKQILIESNMIIYQKLKFVGVGYRVSPVEKFENQLIVLKLGYSHLIYFRIPPKTDIVCFKRTLLFLSGYSYQQLTFIASKLRENKVPEQYKGKGILYANEKIVLKEGKKV